MTSFIASCGENARLFFRRHPLLRDALLWAIPALIFGAALRLILLSYSPYAYWGSDSRSYYSFASQALHDFNLSLPHKRRFLYPILLLPLSALPGSVLQWLAWFQAGLGLVTIAPLAYAVRKLFVSWRLLILPITVAFAGMPILLWYEHELLGETLFFAAIVWTVAGWSAWVSEKNEERARRLWWCFFVPLSVVALTKPSARFFFPGLALGLVLVAAWRGKGLGRRAVIAGAVLLVLMLNMGESKQSAWLLYTTVFPLTQLDTPLHADYKREIRPLVEKMRGDLDAYSENDDEPFYFLRNPEHQDALPLWKKLGTQEKKQTQVYKDLAFEAIKAQPGLFLYISLQRLVRSANMNGFKEERFGADYFAKRFKPQYEGKTSAPIVQQMFGGDMDAPLPPYKEFSRRIAPHPDSKAAQWLTRYVLAYQEIGSIVGEPSKKKPDTLARYWLKPLGWWLLAGTLFSFFGPYRKTLGVWTITIGGYLVGVFLVGTQNVRYFGAAYAVLLLLLAVPVDLAWRGVCGAIQSRRARPCGSVAIAEKPAYKLRS